MTERTPNGERYAAPALEKGLDILEYLSSQTQPLSLREIASGLGRTRSEIYRMVTVLSKRGYLFRRSHDDKYRLSDKLLRIGSQRPVIRALVHAAMPYMTNLAEDLRCPCHLAVRADGEVVTVASAESPEFLSISIREGYRSDPWRSAAGLCLLSSSEDPDVDDAVCLQALAELDTIGYLIRQDTIATGFTEISAPIRASDQPEALAALTVVAMTETLPPSDSEEALATADRVNRAALEISQSLQSA